MDSPEVLIAAVTAVIAFLTLVYSLVRGSKSEPANVTVINNIENGGNETSISTEPDEPD